MPDEEMLRQYQPLRRTNTGMAADLSSISSVRGIDKKGKSSDSFDKYDLFNKTQTDIVNDVDDNPGNDAGEGSLTDLKREPSNLTSSHR